MRRSSETGRMCGHSERVGSSEWRRFARERRPSKPSGYRSRRRPAARALSTAVRARLDGIYLRRHGGPFPSSESSGRCASTSSSASCARDRRLRREAIKSRTRITKEIGEVDRKIGKQIKALEADIEPELVGRGIAELRAEKEKLDLALADLGETSRTPP